MTQLAKILEFKAGIRQILDPKIFEGWLESIILSVEGETLIVSEIPHPAFKYDIQKNYDGVFKAFAKDLFGVEKIEYRLEPQQKIQQLDFELPELSPGKIEYPTDLCRISPFKPLKRGQSRELVQKVLFQNSYGSVRYEGRILGIDDEDVFMTLLRDGREQLFRGEKTVEINIGLRDMLRKVGRSYGGSNKKWLIDSLQRLSGGQMIFKTPRFQFSGCFLSNVTLDEETGKLVIYINPNLGRMYLNNAYTLIDYQQRLQLQDTGKRLHAFLNSQRNPTDQFSFSAETAKIIMNSDAEIKEIRRKANRDLKGMVKLGFLKDFSIEKNGYKVFFSRKNKA